MIGETISHYKILEKLGEGGMGVVYKAQDTKLDRTVALKFLPHYLTTDQKEKERFYHEARSVSSLNHANVTTVYEIDEQNDQMFLAMELVEGKTLKKLIAEGESLSLNKVLEMAIQICDGLAAAHEKGIVHRDIKSDNIMLTSRGQVKIMDFGLAKVKGATKLTKAGSTVGTAAYMSPEQAQGEKVDHRSDIFSFGVVLYELLATKLPFRGEHHAALMYSLINEEPQPIARFNNSVTPDLERIVMKALAKDRDERYQHIDDMLADLRRERKNLEYARTAYVRSTTTQLAEPAPPADRKTGETPTPLRKYAKYVVGLSAIIVVGLLVVVFNPFSGDVSEKSGGTVERKTVAVLPFENFGEPGQEYFADGITEEITTRLSGLSGLGVIARSSAMQYKKTTKMLPQIGEELRAAYILQGTIRWGTTQDGKPKVRINPALVKVSDATQLWSQSYDAVMSDVFTVQSDIASQVAVALGVTLLQPERHTLEAKPTENSDAYDAYLRGNDYFRRSYLERDFQIGIQMLEKAIQLDPKFALAYARVSEAHSAMYWFYYDRTQARIDKAKSAADEAFRLDPNLTDVHQAYGYYYYWCHLDYDNALKEFALAQKNRPNDSRLLLGIGSVQRRQGKMELAVENMKKATELDPRSSELFRNTSETYRLLRKYEEADRFVNQSIALAPDVADGYFEKVFTELIWTGDTRKAKGILRQAALVSGIAEHPGITFMRVSVEIFDKNYDDALSVISTGPGEYNDQFQFVPRQQLLAQVYGLMGKRDLERVYYDSARIVIERKIQQQPDDARFHSALGIALAGLGRKEAAIREGKRGVELLPVSKEAWRGAYRVKDLATIYVIVGKHSEALDLLRQLLTMPSEISVAILRIDPTYGPLRDNPDFHRLLQEFGK
jgi:serine/threonine protein kinase/TolB-like protein/tetratricopeptide (TPR) repeat protein